MLAFTVNDTKTFMTLLLKGDTFDHFTFRQAEINSYASIHINGQKDDDMKDSPDDENYCLWSEIKSLLFQAIKGKRPPKSMKLVLSLPKDKTACFPNTKAVFLNLLFREHTLLCTTAIAQINFSMNKESEQLWEEKIILFFRKHNIGIEIQK